MLPLLVHRVGAELAVPLLTLAQFVGNLSRIVLGWRQVHWRPVGCFLVTALPAAVVGAFSFISIPATWAVRLIGFILLCLVALRWSGRLRFVPGKRTLLVGGAVTGLLSGLVGSAGPLGAAVFLSLGLPPVAYVASEASTALALHAVKMAVYQQRLLLPSTLWLLALMLGVAMVLGTWASKRYIERLPPERFRFYVTLLLAVLGARMLLFG